MAIFAWTSTANPSMFLARFCHEITLPDNSSGDELFLGRSFDGLQGAGRAIDAGNDCDATLRRGGADAGGPLAVLFGQMSAWSGAGEDRHHGAHSFYAGAPAAS